MTSARKPYARWPGKGVFGERLKAERIRRNFKVRDFARLLDVHECSLTGWENRGIMPNLKDTIAIAQLLDCSIDWLCGLED